MNTFALATLTLSTLCLGGAFAAIVTARHVRLRRDAEDRHALGRVLEDVDRQLERLAAAEESSATAQIVGRLERIDERIELLATESEARAEKPERPEPTEPAAARLESVGAARPAPAALARLDRGALEHERPAVPGAEEAAALEVDHDDPELAALLAKFDDDSFSFAGAARAKAQPTARSKQAPSPPSAGVAFEQEPTHELADAALITDAFTTAAPAAQEPSDVFDQSTPSSEEPAAADASSQGAAALVDEPADVSDAEFAISANAESADALVDPAVVDACVGGDATDATHIADHDDELELDDLVLFFHEDDQGEAIDTLTDDVALFDEVPASRVAAMESNPRPVARVAAPTTVAPRTDASRASGVRRSIDELSSLTERLCQPTRDRSERLRLVTELHGMLARVRR